jgi:hypothetical protein
MDQRFWLPQKQTYEHIIDCARELFPGYDEVRDTCSDALKNELFRRATILHFIRIGRDPRRWMEIDPDDFEFLSEFSKTADLFASSG